MTSIQSIVWPKARDVGRIGDMSPTAHLRVGWMQTTMST